MVFDKFLELIVYFLLSLFLVPCMIVDWLIILLIPGLRECM